MMPENASERENLQDKCLELIEEIYPILTKYHPMAVLDVALSMYVNLCIESGMSLEDACRVLIRSYKDAEMQKEE